MGRRRAAAARADAPTAASRSPTACASAPGPRSPASWTVTDRRAVDALSPFYVWTPDYAEKRLAWKRRHPLHVLLLRTYRIPRPVTVKVRDDYGGCRSWLEITRDLPFEGTPVLSDEEFERASEEIAGIAEATAPPPTPTRRIPSSAPRARCWRRHRRRRRRRRRAGGRRPRRARRAAAPRRRRHLGAPADRPAPRARAALDEVDGRRAAGRRRRARRPGHPRPGRLPVRRVQHGARASASRSCWSTPTAARGAVGATLDAAAERLGCDLVALVDVGGDVLAHGDEPGSPARCATRSCWRPPRHLRRAASAWSSAPAATAS